MSDITVGDLWVSNHSLDWVVRIKDFYKQDGTVELLDDDDNVSSCHVTDFIEDFMFLEKPKPKHSHYHKNVSQYDTIDVYAVCKIFDVQDTSGCLQHAIKKLLVTGQRGHKDRQTDIQNAIDTLNRLLELESE